jgi:fructose-1-phosphate kinase PfkB-like protein
MTIFGILLNPTIDEIFEIDGFQVGGTYQVNRATILPVGKAISVAIGMRTLAQDGHILIKVLAFVGKSDLSLYSNFLEKYGIEKDLIIILIIPPDQIKPYWIEKIEPQPTFASKDFQLNKMRFNRC